MTSLYPYLFLLSLSSLIGWFFLRNNKKRSLQLRLLFFISFLMYLGTFYAIDLPLKEKIPVLIRDLFVLGLTSQFFGWLKLSKGAFAGLMVLIVMAFLAVYKPIMETSIATAAPEDISTHPDVKLWGELSPEGEVLVELRPGTDLEALRERLEQEGGSISPAFEMADASATELDEFYKIDIPPARARAIELFLLKLVLQFDFEYFEGNEVVQIDPIEIERKRIYPGIKGPAVPNDPALEQMWNFKALDMDRYYQLLTQAKPKAGKTARIFILDTGVDAQHEDLKGNYKSYARSEDNDPMGHGTHCAGIAAAVSNNHKGLASFSNGEKYLEVSSIKVLSAMGRGTQQNIIQGILKAADAGADVISMSLGGRASRSKTRAYAQAISYANRKGAIVVAAAGNSNLDARDYAPANTPGIITVAALDTNMNRASFSNKVGGLKYKICAPGVAIYSTTPSNTYKSFNGTSMAAPHVAGLLGMMKSLNPALTTSEAYELLHDHGKRVSDQSVTGRCIHPSSVLQAMVKGI